MTQEAIAQRNAEIAARLRRGETREAIAADFGLSARRVYEIGKIKKVPRSKKTAGKSCCGCKQCRPLSPRDVQIRERLLAGETYDSIALTFGVSRQRIGQIARVKKFPSRRAGLRGRMPPDIVQEEMVRLVQAGVSLQETAVKVHWSVHYVKKVLQAKGVSLPCRTGPPNTTAAVAWLLTHPELPKREVAYKTGVSEAMLQGICRRLRGLGIAVPKHRDARVKHWRFSENRGA